MSDIDFQLFALEQEIENLKVALSFTADQDRKSSLYEQFSHCFSERIRLLQHRFNAYIEEADSVESGLERSVGE